MKKLLLLLILFTSIPAAAQPRLDLRLLRPNAPDYYFYQLYFAAYCGDSPIYDLEERQLILEEYHGLIDSTNYSLDIIPSADADHCYDIALAFDNSSTMSAPTLNRVIEAGKAFIDSMLQPCQSASIISFADRPTLHTFLGNDHDASKQAFDDMKPGGKRVLYDALYAGMVEMEENGRQGQALVMALTTGSDNGSSIDQQRLLESARRWRIRLFVFGLGIATPDTEIVTLCRETGGLYVSVPNEDSLLVMLTDFEGFVQRSYDEYRLVRRTPNTVMQDVLIRLRLEACDDSVWVQRVFKFSELVSTHDAIAPTVLSLGQGYPNPVSGGQDLRIPFALDSKATQRGVTLKIFDALGREVGTVLDGDLAPGPHTAIFSVAELPAGLYIYRLTAGNDISSGRFCVLR